MDRRIVDELVSRTGRIISEASEVGGWPELAVGGPEIDSDRDGMPDHWEVAGNLNPFDPNDRNLPGEVGYTALVIFLAERAASLIS